jgi:hypothetical protein
VRACIGRSYSDGTIFKGGSGWHSCLKFDCFVRHEALSDVPLDTPTAHATFDKNLTRILKRAAEKVDRQEFNLKGHVLIEARI